MALLISQAVTLDILADGTSTDVKVPTHDLIQGGQQIAGRPAAVEITNSGFGSGVSLSGSLNTSGSELSLTFSPAPPAGHGTARFNLLFNGD